jgi:hypothetical protein
MMKIERLYELVRDCSVECRTGPAVVVNGEPASEQEIEQISNTGEVPPGVTEFYSMPHVSEVQKERPDLVIVDMVFIDVAVDKAKAEAHRAEFVEILNTYPDIERLRSGPTYMELGAEFGDQGFALRIMAIGSVLGFWEIISGKALGMGTEEAVSMAGVGFLLISGYNPDGIVSNK